MGRCRPCDKFPWKNPNFIGVIIALILVYLLFNYEFLFRENNVGVIFYIILFLFLMAMWSYFAAAFTNPGPVPVFWGIYSEHQSGERKYCLVCHNFKPERAHHCSRCKQCILNMDHHCPWINNCVGFDNRKFFMLFLTYLVLALYVAFVIMIIVMIKDCKLLFSGKPISVFDFVIKVLLFLAFFGLILTLTFFTITHYKFVATNTTTLEDLVANKKKKEDSYRISNS